jgi:hypothetical protein
VVTAAIAMMVNITGSSRPRFPSNPHRLTAATSAGFDQVHPRRQRLCELTGER